MQSHFYISLHGFPEKFIYEGYIIITQSSSPDTTTSHLRKDIKDVAPTLLQHYQTFIIILRNVKP